MGRQIVLCVGMIAALGALVSCGFNSRGPGSGDDAGPQLPSPPVDDAALDAPDHVVIDAARDAALDAPVDAPPPTGCFVRWFAGDLAISAPSELTTLSTGGSERDPWVSPDGLTIYFVRDPGSVGGGDVFRASRNSTAESFRNTQLVTELSTPANEGRASLTSDGLMITLSSNRGVTNTKFEIYIAQRSSALAAFAPPSTLHLNMVNGDASDHHDAFLSGDGTRLYLAPLLSRQRIVVAQRSSPTADFAPPTDVLGISDGSHPDADPALSTDERVIVFSSRRPNSDTDLWYATRPTSDAPFGAPRLIPVVSSGVDDGDPVLSSDGCTLYFASRRNGNDYDLFAARIAL